MKCIVIGFMVLLLSCFVYTQGFFPENDYGDTIRVDLNVEEDSTFFVHVVDESKWDLVFVNADENKIIETFNPWWNDSWGDDRYEFIWFHWADNRYCYKRPYFYRLGIIGEIEKTWCYELVQSNTPHEEIFIEYGEAKKT